MKTNVFIKMTLMLTAFAFTMNAAVGQGEWTQVTACPGWNNPTSFTAGDTYNYYSGQGISISSSNKPCPNPITGNTGVTSMGTNYTASQLATVNTGGGGSTLPNASNQFVIMSNLTGHDPNTNNQLPYVPTQFNTYDTTPGTVNTNITRSIRIGDGYSNGSGSDNYSGAALYYTMQVTPLNAMLYLYYSVVAEAPGHGQKGNPTFVIRVMKRNAANQWTQITDTLAYYISSTPSSDQSDNCANMGYVTLAGAGETGWHQVGSGYSSIYYKDWEKVCINLSNHMFETLQIQVLIYDCIYNAHYAYGYIAGECRPMRLSSSGCPPGMDTSVTTLSAPRNMNNYVWYASEFGVLPEGEEADPQYTWRQLSPDQATPPASQQDYGVVASDFRVTRRFNASGVPVTIPYDTIGNYQTFRCKLTSAIDPSKPFDSYLYVTVQNTKPTMRIDSVITCDSLVRLWNTSYVPGDPTLTVLDSTQWWFYNNIGGYGEADTILYGDSVSIWFPNDDIKSVRVRSVTTDTCCYSEAIYPIQPRIAPTNRNINITERILCDVDPTTLSDPVPGDNNYRVWYFRQADADADDMSLTDSVTGTGNENRQITRSFSHGVEPIELKVYNGTTYVDSRDASQDHACYVLLHDTVSVFLHPELEVTGDTVVCDGSMTDATVRALGVDSCTYQWSLSPNAITGGLPSGPTLRVVPYADTATYYVRVTSPQGCVAWDSLHAYLVQPQLAILPEDGRICPGDKATLVGSSAHHFTWTASPADPSLDGQDSLNTIVVSPSQTTTYTMVGHGANNCDATPLQKTVTIVPLPVSKVTLNPGFIDTDDPQVVLKDESEYSVRSSWLFHDGSRQEGREVNHLFENCVGFDSVNVTLTSFNDLGCPKEYPFSIPVSVFTAWFPNIFTPGSDDGNAYFSFYTINDYEYFHIYIYNRRGELVYESADPKFKWDGTRDGEPLPQGAYVYTCRFRKPGTPTLGQMKGTVTIIR